MATLRVPTDHATLAAAVTACVSGDIIELEDGIHFVSSLLAFSTKTDITIIAQNRRAATISSSVSLLSNTSFRRVRFIGLTITWTGSWLMSASAGEFSLIDCVIDLSGAATSSTTDRIYSGVYSEGYAGVRRNCRCIGYSPSTTHGRILYHTVALSGGTSYPLALIIENNTFENFGVYNSSTYQMIRAFGSGTNTSKDVDIIIRNNSLINCHRGESSAFVGFGTFTVSGVGAVRCGIYNNYFEDGAFITSGNMIYATSYTQTAFLNDPIVIRNNVQYNANDLSYSHVWYNGFAPYVDIADNQDALVRQVDGTSFVALEEGLLPTGAMASGTFGAVYWDRDMTPCDPTVGALALPPVPTGCAVFVQRQRVPALGATVTNYLTATYSLSTTSGADHLAPGACAEELRESAYKSGLVDLSDLRVWYDPRDGHIYAHTPLMTHSIVSDSLLAAVLGSFGSSSVYLSDLGADRNELRFALQVDEDVVADEHRGTVEYTDIGAVLGPETPEDSARWIYTFRVLSAKRDGDADSSWRQPDCLRILSSYEAGRQARFWRDLAIDTPWTLLDNARGYSDIVPADVRDAVTLTWYDTARTRFELVLSGVEVR